MHKLNLFPLPPNTMRLAKGCRNYILVLVANYFVAIFAVLYVLGSGVFSWSIVFILIIMIKGIILFFRDPELPIGEGVVSPANGKVTAIDTNEIGEGEEKGEGTVAIRIFMNVWNIHVNRSPMRGTVRSVTHRPGGHMPAFDKDAETNERVITELDTDIGMVKVVQIAGSVARRIVPYITQGQELETGERIGIIRLGSRVDLHLPAPKVRVLAKVGDIVRPGQTLADVVIGSSQEEGRVEKEVGSDPTEKEKGKMEEPGVEGEP